jgi:predicted O-methyltransferase YrrM
MRLNEYLTENGAFDMPDWENYCQQIQIQADILSREASRSKTVLEIGFNAGHSAEMFLISNPDVKVTSIDIGMHQYSYIGAKYFETYYPGRHEMIWGDSTQMVPYYTANNRGKTFDLIFIDGGHTDPVPYKDLCACKALASRNTILIMNDVVYDSNMGPTNAWKQMIDERQVSESYNQVYQEGRGMSIGRYNF